ncbi:DUF6221 family protein [Amycolatopsis nigrescens]|uniref:DUF6221 family protein n=1 Tax=Amycolatopsis nigrescens TaxID=381445 RepID=UPI00037AF957|nr:DUF6221 family protein [Amycolatopsis nigrescens]
MSIVSFLRARIHEDESRAARGVTGGLLTPQRVLAECRSKRLILDTLERERREAATGDDLEWFLEAESSAISWLLGESAEQKSKVLMRQILRAMALPYSGHPDYRRDWLPS